MGCHGCSPVDSETSLGDSSNVVELVKSQGGLLELRSVRYFSLLWHSALSSLSSHSSSDGVAGHCSSLDWLVDQTDSMIQLTPTLSRATVVVSTACATGIATGITEKHVSKCCCSARLSSESECSNDVTDESCETPVSGLINDFTRGRCAYSIVVFVSRLKMDAALVAVGITLIDVRVLIESDLELTFEITWTSAVLESLVLPNDDRCCLVWGAALGRTYSAVVTVHCRQGSPSRLACRLDGSCRSLNCVDRYNYDKLL